VKFSEPITIVGVELAVADGLRAEAETAVVLQTAPARARAAAVKRDRGRGIGLVLLEGGRSAWHNPRWSPLLSTRGIGQRAVPSTGGQGEGLRPPSWAP
jgi:hypothetical protein